MRGARPGPTLLCVGGLHGNEPAGVIALRRALAWLEGCEERLKGEFVAVTGNVRALRAGRRFVDADLNRAWTEERLAWLRRDGKRPYRAAEDHEQRELLETIERVVEEARGPVYVVDLHTTSGSDGVFSTFGDTLLNREFAAHFPVPMILGLEELVEGTLLALLGRHGLVAVVLETGQHGEAAAVERAEAAVRVAVASAGLLAEREVEGLDAGRTLLRACCGDLPRALEMRYRHMITDDDAFRMLPGFRNFQEVREGELLAHDVRGEIRAPWDARILMPLYQEQGDEGFFLVREFSPFWLRVSSWLRRVRADRIAPLLPGVHRDPAEPDEIVVDKHVARWFALQFFHLLGFRREEDAGDRLVLTRRRFDAARYLHRLPRPEPLH